MSDRGTRLTRAVGVRYRGGSAPVPPAVTFVDNERPVDTIAGARKVAEKEVQQ